MSIVARTAGRELPLTLTFQGGGVVEPERRLRIGHGRLAFGDEGALAACG